MGNVQSFTALCQPCEDGHFEGCCRDEDDELSRKIDELDFELQDIKQQNIEFRKQNMKLQQELQQSGQHRVPDSTREMGRTERVPADLNVTQNASYGLPTPRTLNSFGERGARPLQAARESFNAMLGLGKPSMGQEDEVVLEDQYLRLPDPPRVSPSYQQGDELSKTAPASANVHSQLLQLKRENEELKQRQVQYDALSWSAPGGERDLQIRVDQLARENQFLKKKIRSLAHL